MPKLRPETEKIKASNIVKDLQKNGMSQSKLAKKEGVTRQAIHQRLQRNYVKVAFEDLLEKSGVSDKKLAETISNGIDAEKSVSADILVDENGQVKKDFDNYGAVMVPDWPSRHKFVQTALQLKGHIKDGNITINNNNLTKIDASIEGLTTEEIRSFIAQIGKGSLQERAA